MQNKTWGGRFSKPLHPEVRYFNASLFFDYALYEYDIEGSLAHIAMLCKIHLLEKEEYLTLKEGLLEILEELRSNLHPLDEESEDIHMFIEQLLIKKVGDVGKKLHTGRSRNDQVALDLRLYMRDHLDKIKNLLASLGDVLESLQKKHEHDLMPGYTHLQQAQPITLGKYFGAYWAMFQRDLDRLLDCRQRMNFSPLGAGALAGSQLPLDRDFVASELGFLGIIENTLDAVSDRDYILEFLNVASLIMMHLSRMSEDMILWATQEFHFLTLDDAFSTGSSLMPNKKNPDVLELIRGKSGRVFGNMMGFFTVMKGLPLSYNKDMQEDKEALFDSVKTVMECLSIMSLFLQNTHFNVEKMKKAAEHPYLTATAKVEALVKEGVSFRDAHHQVGQWILDQEK